MALHHIKKIFIMTLEATPHRKWGMIGALDARQFPMDKVEPVHGIDGLKYDTHEMLIEDAVADGFKFFGTYEKYLERPIPMVAGTWSACRLLRHISKLSSPCLLMEDDWVFLIDYEEVVRRLRMLRDPETHIAALILKLWGRDRKPKFQMNDGYWIQGIPASAACANVITPEGAKLLLEQFGKHEGSTLEKTIRTLGYPASVALVEPVGRHLISMGYSRANPDGTRKSYVSQFEHWQKGYNKL